MAEINLNPMHCVQLTVTIPKALPIRMWTAKGLIWLAAFVLGCGIKVETEDKPWGS